MMVGRYVAFKVDKEKLDRGEPVLQVAEARMGTENGLEWLSGVNLAVFFFFFLGLAGVAGNGQMELFDAIVGVEQLDEGRITLGGEEITHCSPVEISMKGLASIPQDRILQGLLMGFTVEENLILGLQRRLPFRKGAFLDQKAITSFADTSIEDYDIATPSPQQRAGVLSGGNLQKVILARELSQKPKCVLASSPTRGLDVGAMKYVHNRLVELRHEGAAVLLISEDLDEIFNIADRIAVIFRGRIMGVFAVDEVDKERIGLLMAGVQEVS